MGAGVLKLEHDRFRKPIPIRDQARGQAFGIMLRPRAFPETRRQGESPMTHELFWLMMTIIMTGLLWIPYTIDRIMVRGLEATLDNPGPNALPQSPWAQRLMAAHTNTVENLVV